MPNYGLIQGIFIVIAATCVIVLALVGPENHGSHFEKGKAAFQPGASNEDIDSILEEPEELRDVERLSAGSGGHKEREDTQYVEAK